MKTIDKIIRIKRLRIEPYNLFLTEIFSSLKKELSGDQIFFKYNNQIVFTYDKIYNIFYYQNHIGDNISLYNVDIKKILKIYVHLYLDDVIPSNKYFRIISPYEPH